MVSDSLIPLPQSSPLLGVEARELYTCEASALNCTGGPLSWVVIGIQGSWVRQVEWVTARVNSETQLVTRSAFKLWGLVFLKTAERNILRFILTQSTSVS